MAFHTKISEAYGNIRRKPNQPCNYLNRGHKSKVNILGQYASTPLKTMHDSGPVQILIILHVLCVAPGNKHNKKPCINSTRSREIPD